METKTKQENHLPNGRNPLKGGEYKTKEEREKAVLNESPLIDTLRRVGSREKLQSYTLCKIREMIWRIAR